LLLSDRVTGVGVATLGAFAVYGGLQQPGVPGQDVGPSVFPTVIGLGLLLCGALVALGVGRGFEAPAEAAGAEGPDTVHPSPPRFGELRALLPPVLLVFYVLAVDRLGFLLTAGLIALALSLALGARPRLALPIAVLAPPFIHIVFNGLLRVPLPEGLLAAPW
jgi:putative tricarboxylic transport membrane protein